LEGVRFGGLRLDVLPRLQNNTHALHMSCADMSVVICVIDTLLISLGIQGGKDS